jgi:hypothetical protein
MRAGSATGLCFDFTKGNSEVGACRWVLFDDVLVKPKERPHCRFAILRLGDYEHSR